MQRQAQGVAGISEWWDSVVTVMQLPYEYAVEVPTELLFPTPPPAPPPQARSKPAAPRSTAELTSGRWTPEDAFELGQRETVQEIIRENELKRAAANGYTDPNERKPDPTNFYLLAAAAATVGIVILTRR